MHFYGHGNVSSQMAVDILKRLRFDNDTIRTVGRLVMYHDYGTGMKPDRRMVRRAMNKIGEDLFPMLFEVKKADIMAQSLLFREEKLNCLEMWKKLYEEIMAQKECVSLKTLAVTGRDLIDRGMKPGPELGETLERLLNVVLDHPEYNNKDYLLEMLEKGMSM